MVARSSKHQFQAACAALPSALEGLRLGESVALEPIVRALARGAAVDVAGVGGSEGPARFLTAVLAELCVPSTYRPVTHFLERREATSRVLVVFSQGLSPNARLMLSRASEYACALLVTSASSVEGEEGTELRTKGVTLLPLEVPLEPRALVRLTGPTLFRALAYLLGLEVGRRMGRPEPSFAVSPKELARAYQASQAQGRELSHLLPQSGLEGIIVGEPIVDLVQVEAAKWREALWCAPPPVFDALGFAHGPLQTLEKGEAPLLVVHGAGERGLSLFARVRACLERAGRRSVSVPLALPAPLSALEVDAVINEILLERMPECPEEWPGQGWDGPLYGLGDPEDCSALA